MMPDVDVKKACMIKQDKWCSGKVKSISSVAIENAEGARQFMAKKTGITASTLESVGVFGKKESLETFIEIGKNMGKVVREEARKRGVDPKLIKKIDWKSVCKANAIILLNYENLFGGDQGDGLLTEQVLKKNCPQMHFIPLLVHACC
jgi:hypothetical protein